MNITEMLTALAAISIVTSLITEAVKKLLDTLDKSYHSNILAGIVAVILSAAYGVAHVLITDTSVTAGLIIYLIAMIILSWLCAMLGYDKVVQTIKQLTGGTDE